MTEQNPRALAPVQRLVGRPFTVSIPIVFEPSEYFPGEIVCAGRPPEADDDVVGFGVTPKDAFANWLRAYADLIDFIDDETLFTRLPNDKN
jgi:hypothetical protein